MARPLDELIPLHQGPVRLADRRYAPPSLGVSTQSPTTGFRIGNPGLMTRLGSLASPLTAVIVLYLAALVNDAAFGPEYMVLASLVFFILTPASWSRSGEPIDLGAQILTPWLSAAGVLIALALITGYGQAFPPAVILAWLIVTPVAQAMLLLALPSAMSRLVRLRRRPHQVVVIGANSLGRAFAARLAADTTAHSVVHGFFDDRLAAGRLDGSASRLLGPLSQAGAYVKAHGINQIYVALPLSQGRLMEIMESMRDSTASMFHLPDVGGIDLIQPRIDTQSGFPVVGLCESPFYGVNAMVKRAMDLVIASVALLLLSPLMALIAIAVKRSSPGPVLFAQPRYGLDGTSISVWKFRSMSVCEDGVTAYRQVTRGDPRITPLGAFLRRTSLDELPQLFNVIQGRMSIVGPRPHVLRVNEQYRSLIPGYMLRHKVLPGITGWAQVNGHRGGDDLDSMRNRVAFDLDYLRNWSVWLDVRILLRTVTLVFRDSRAY